LLQKGLKYNIHAKKKNWLQTLALEAKTAITQLPSNEREVYRKLVADRKDTLQRQNSPNPNHYTQNPS
jgi:ribosomal protein RSM22 (predicted rRNA methylase)